MKKSIKKIIPSEKVNMGGHIIEQALPNIAMDQLDPFLLIHHAEWTYEGGQLSKDLGIGGHPHRGFSPVTFVFKGDVRHQDSLGNDMVVSEGGTQWMHAGKGITHSERPSDDLASNGGVQEIIQFWVNTPAQYKMDSAYYLPISKEDTPCIETENYSYHVVAGEYEGIKGPAETFSPMLLMRGTIMKESQLDLEIDQSYNTLLYLLDGELEIEGQTVKAKNLVCFSTKGKDVQLKAHKETRFILLAGEPIGEKVTSYGPFVMNTQTEILEAMRDSQQGKMGILIEND